MEKLLRETIQRSIENCEVAGVSVLVQKEGKEVCFLAEGMADIGKKRKIERDTIYRLYSQTKPVTGAAAMILMERGQLDLYQPVSELLPGFKDQKVWDNGEIRPVKREMIVKDLLQMTSGVCYPGEENETARQMIPVFEELEERLHGDHPMTTQELANVIGSYPLAYEPGSSYKYGTSADVLGAVIEVVTGKALGEFMAEEIFQPLGMKDTGFWVPEEKQERLARSYETVKAASGSQLVLYEGDYLGIQNQMKRKPAYEAGGAGLASTLDDYMKFARMLLQGGVLDGVRILKETTVKYFTTGQLRECQQEAWETAHEMIGYTYSNFMRVCSKPSQAYMLTREGEYGWDGWLGMYFANFPQEDMTILLGMQKKDSGTWDLTRKLRNIILSSI